MARKQIAIESQGGFTLIELLIASLLTVLVLFVAGGLLISVMKTITTVTTNNGLTNWAQLAAGSFESGIRNSSDSLLTNPTGNDQLLVARVASRGATISWSCAAWYYAASANTLYYTISSTAIPAAPTTAQLATWTVLDSTVKPTSGTSIFSDSGGQVILSFTSSAGSNPTAAITTSAFSRAGSTGTLACQ